ncbi:MAG: YhfC family glutamic-type intramembrane protease [Bacillota bacterium]|jgi:uncharacterized membrane protein YhfC|nr:YhfC family glutamic-type intramembrane protease [Eubacteriales bacterium]MDI9492496.1 YhfC family glutamic-type intramembrane protease [Bacillota bacterium]HRV32830.1 YhfC family glutamic-type intramembrane protease [Anaerovoracaceae bacterium]MDD3537065.1 YhfC family glutamic-type intramembrane protease [Eubacteriales bacterium]MDD3864117.1 YhfC family glutamic-type intramembrane protease [Eubacteriales bacterium]
MDGNLISAPLTISSASLAAMWVTFIVTAILPLAGWLILAQRWKGAGTAVVAGALGFFLPQVVIRIPLLSVPAAAEGLGGLYGQSPVAYFLFLAFTAGLFETTGRLFVFRSLLSNRLSYRTGVAAGFGHGAVEALILVGITYGANLYLSYTVNGGAPLPEDPSLAAGVAQLATTPAGLFLAAAVERVCTVCFHVAASLFLCYMISIRKTLQGFLLCLAAHTALDFIVPQIQVRTGSYVLTEGVMVGVAALSVGLIVHLQKKFEVRDIPPDSAGEAAKEGY